MQLFFNSTYRQILHQWMNANNHIKGINRLMAQAAHTHPSWVTRVLKEEVQLTPDQALGLSDLMKLSPTESDYFLILVDFERAATPALKSRLKEKLNQLKKNASKAKLDIQEPIVEEHFLAYYYSSWTYPAIHVQCMISPQNIQELFQKFSIPIENLKIILGHLCQMNLLKVHKSQFSATDVNIHLPSDHPLAQHAHTLWRQKTIAHLQSGDQRGLHYSATHCLSKNDFLKIQEILKEQLLKYRKIIQQSPSEELTVLAIDWYKL